MIAQCPFKICKQYESHENERTGHSTYVLTQATFQMQSSLIRANQTQFVITKLMPPSLKSAFDPHSTIYTGISCLLV